MIKDKYELALAAGAIASVVAIYERFSPVTVFLIFVWFVLVVLVFEKYFGEK